MDRLSSSCIWQAAGLSSCRGRKPGFPDEAELDSVAHDPEHVVPASDLFAIPQLELHVVGIDLVILEKGLEAILHGLFDLRAGYPVIGGVSLIREAVIQEGPCEELRSPTSRKLSEPLRKALCSSASSIRNPLSLL